MGALDDMFGKQAEDIAAPEQSLLSAVPGATSVVAATGLASMFDSKQPSKSEIEADVISDLFDPVHESEMQRIRMQAMLTEFMASDPVISTYDADSVIEAFNQISQMTPRAALQPAVMRGQLRKMLQQQDAMEPFEAGQLLNVEQSLKSISEPSSLPLTTLPSGREEKEKEPEKPKVPK